MLQANEERQARRDQEDAEGRDAATRGLRAIGALKVHGKAFSSCLVGLFVMLNPQISTNKSDLASLRKSESENRTFENTSPLLRNITSYESRVSGDKTQREQTVRVSFYHFE